VSLRLLRFVNVLGLAALLMGFAACGGNGSTTKTTPAPTITFSADSTSVNSGQTVTLTWASTNATSVTITPSILASGQSALPISGSQQIRVTANTTYTAVAIGPGGSTQQTEIDYKIVV
jgi:plastocyanin